MSQASSLRLLRIFIACPGDVAREKAHILQAVASLESHAKSKGHTLEVKEWHQCSPGMGRPQ